jgi:drug/metabolite transporter (DMT)-like permease
LNTTKTVQFQDGLAADMEMKTTLGCLAVFGSAFFFYLATVVIKWSAMAGLAIPSSMFTISRFAFGFATVLVVMAVQRRKIRIVKKRYLIGRAVGNAMAVFCFFKGVETTSVAQANILNMTYPLFIALFLLVFSQGAAGQGCPGHHGNRLCRGLADPVAGGHGL